MKLENMIIGAIGASAITIVSAGTIGSAVSAIAISTLGIVTIASTSVMKNNSTNDIIPTNIVSNTDQQYIAQGEFDHVTKPCSDVPPELIMELSNKDMKDTVQDSLQYLKTEDGQTMRMISFKNITLSDDDMESLLVTIKYHPTMAVLDLQNCTISERAVKMLVEFLHNPQLKLDTTHITDGATTILKDMYETGSSMVGVAGNTIDTILCRDKKEDIDTNKQHIQDGENITIFPKDKKFVNENHEDIDQKNNKVEINCTTEIVDRVDNAIFNEYVKSFLGGVVVTCGFMGSVIAIRKYCCNKQQETLLLTEDALNKLLVQADKQAVQVNDQREEQYILAELNNSPEIVVVGNSFEDTIEL